MKWSAEQPDISAANSDIDAAQVGSGKAHIGDLSDVSSDVGGRKFNGRIDSW